MDHGEHPGFPQRPPASAHLLIDSLDRYRTANIYGEQQFSEVQWVLGSGPPGNDFSISRNTSLLYGYFTRVGITQLQLSYAVPTVVEDKNDTFYITDETTSDFKSVTLDPGYYTPSELAAQVQDKIQALGGTWASYTATMGSDKQIVVSSNNGHLFNFNSPVYGAAPGTANQVARCWKLLGIGGTNSDDPTYGGTAAGKTQQSFDRSPNCLYTNYVDIRSNTLTKYQRVKDADTAAEKNKTSIIARVYLVPPGQAFKVTDDSAPGDSPFTICVDYNTPKHCRWSPDEAIYSLDFQLFDEYGELLPWDRQYPTEFQLTLMASET